MNFIVNKVSIFNTSKLDEEISLVFETSSLTGSSEVVLTRKEDLKNICSVGKDEDKEPIPCFADIVYLLTKEKYEGYTLNCEPNRGTIIIFNGQVGSHIEISYNLANDEYRVLYSQGAYEVAVLVAKVIEKLDLRVVLFGLSEIPTDEVEEEEGVLDSAVSELEKQYVSEEKKEEEQSKSE